MHPDIVLGADLLQSLNIVHMTHERGSRECDDGCWQLAIRTVLAHLLFERSDVDLLRVAMELERDYVSERETELKGKK